MGEGLVGRGAGAPHRRAGPVGTGPPYRPPDPDRPGGGTPDAGPGDRGSVTVEAALALCSLVLVLGLAVGTIAAAAGTVRCIDAARELARLAARGEPELGRAVATDLAPSGATLTLTRDADTVTAEVTAPAVRPLPLRIGGRAVAALEPAAEPSAWPGAEPGGKPNAEPGGKPNAEPGGKPNAEPGGEAGPDPVAGPPARPTAEVAGAPPPGRLAHRPPAGPGSDPP